MTSAVSVEVHQGILLQQLRSLLPNQNVHVNSRKTSSVPSPKSSSYFLEFDVYLPDLNLCFEFQDTYHYVTTWYNHNSLDEIIYKDSIKVSTAHQHGLDLIVVPCWWDGSLGSIAATINFYRPDLNLISNEPAINLNPPIDFFQVPSISGIGELMLASFPVDSSFIVSPSSKWWLGEKYDGIRCCWNSEEQELYFRSGKHVDILPSLINSIPDIFIDGELWFGRGGFSMTRRVIQSNDNVPWNFLRFLSFDVPSLSFHFCPFEDRYDYLLSHLEYNNQFVINAFRSLCFNNSYIKLLKQVIEGGGEGLILRKHASLYEHGRSTNLIKLKSTQGDQEAVVVGKKSDNTIQLQLPDGSCFEVPPAKNLVTNLKIGDVITFSYEFNSRRDTRVNPTIQRIRSDLSWKDVVSNSIQDKLKMDDFTGVHSVGYWTDKRMREFMENFAQQKGYNPLVPETWYNISSDTIRQSKDGRAIVAKFKGGYVQALRHLFPELIFDNLSFMRPSWNEVENRRRFFEEYAKQRNFDPQNATNWYHEARRIMFVKGALGVVQYYQNSVPKALLSLFPSIGLDESKFSKLPYQHFIQRRQFFENFAKSREFDPLIAENWYNQSQEEILATKGAMEVLLYHKRNISKALLDLFPEIGLKLPKLWRNSSWYDPQSRVAFFKKFAEENNFDPYDPSQWYIQSRECIVAAKGAKGVLVFHDFSVSSALVDLFPDIGLDKSKFQFKNYWNSPANRRKYFLDFAEENQFDPYNPKNWTAERLERIKSSKGASRVLRYYHQNAATALFDLFPNIGLKSNLKDTVSWIERKNRRKFFENYAQAKGFDVLNANNWYSQSKDSIMAFKGASGVIAHHNHSISEALIDLFPEIGFDILKFRIKSLWSDTINQRKFFENYAKELEFDPLVPENWYTQSRDQIMQRKGASGVMAYHNNSVASALLNLFPNIGLDKLKLKTKSIWGDIENQRKFFELYAAENKFDPLVPDHWYSQALDWILLFKGAKSILTHYDNNLAKAISVTFPELEVDASKFVQSIPWHHNPANRVKFFEKYARDNHFDPYIANNWYSQTKSTIMSSQGILQVILYHRRSITVALMDLFPNIGLVKAKLFKPK